MGDLTAQQIIDQGLAVAGDPSLGDRALVALNAWLLRKYSEGAFVAKSMVSVPVAAGDTTLTVTWATAAIRRVEHVWLMDPAKTDPRIPVGELKILNFDGQSPGHNSGQQQATRGQPTEVIIIYGASSTMFELTVPADKTYSLAVSCQVADAAVTLASTPGYLFDDTMIKYIERWALGYMKDYAGAASAAAELREMEARDWALVLGRRGQEDLFPLDERNFNRSPLYNPQHSTWPKLF